MYIFARYCPTMPRHISCTPLMREIMHTRDGHPEVGSPKITVLTMVKIIKTNLTSAEIGAATGKSLVAAMAINDESMASAVEKKAEDASAEN